MAKKAVRGERTQAIRNYLDANPSASPNQVVAALAQQGIEVKAGLVSAIKYKKPKAGQKPQHRLGRPAAKTASSESGISLGSLLEAKKLVDLLGGIDQAKKAIETLEMLR